MTTIGQDISYKILLEIISFIKKKYAWAAAGGDLVDISLEENKDIKVVGFKHSEVRIEVAQIVDKAKSYNFPDFWEDKIELLTSDALLIIKDVAQGNNEWQRLETNFKKTLPAA